ncbi:MAG: hypothetical protein AAFX59_10760, partial [Pseudomonadota bacterium]
MDQFAQHPLAHAPAPSRAAVFLDFDGVLVDLAPTPDAIDVPGGLPDLLARLGRATGGATAIVTGRAVADIRSYLPGVTEADVAAALQSGAWFDDM